MLGFLELARACYLIVGGKINTSGKVELVVLHAGVQISS